MLPVQNPNKILFTESVSGENFNTSPKKTCLLGQNLLQCTMHILFSLSGLIDLALLSANAAQLRAVLTVGDKYKYFTLMLWLLAISVTLQVKNFAMHV